MLLYIYEDQYDKYCVVYSAAYLFGEFYIIQQYHKRQIVLQWIYIFGYNFHTTMWCFIVTGDINNNNNNNNCMVTF